MGPGRPETEKDVGRVNRWTADKEGGTDAIAPKELASNGDDAASWRRRGGAWRGGVAVWVEGIDQGCFDSTYVE